MVNFVGFSVVHVLQGSVATYVRCGGMSIHSAYSKFPAESDSDKIFKIGKNLTKLQLKFDSLLFLEHGVDSYSLYTCKFWGTIRKRRSSVRQK